MRSKHLLLMLLLALMAPWVASAQTQSLTNYTLSTDVTTFNSIVSTGTQLSFTNNDDGYAAITFPFAFPYGESGFASGASIACSSNGFIHLGATSVTTSTPSYTSTDRVITPLPQFDGHMGRYTDAGAYWKYDETAGTLTIEYHKLGAYTAASNTYGIYSYQVVFHNNGDIEFIYDEVDHQSATSRTMATYLTDGQKNDRLYVTGAWADPTKSTSYATRPFTPVPEHGLRYTFTRPVVACPRPTNLKATIVPGDGTKTTFSWTENGEATSWQLCINDDEDHLIDMNENPFTYDGLTPEVATTAKVRAYCSDTDQSQWSDPVTFTPTNSYIKTVNEGENTNSYIPFYYSSTSSSWSNYSYVASQFIIPATDLTNLQWGSIEKLTFYNSLATNTYGATYTIYLGETSATTLSAYTDWATLTQVYTGSVSVSGNKMTIVFDQPFNYTNSNLLVGFKLTTTGTSGSSCTWKGVNGTTSGVSRYSTTSTSTTASSFLPQMTIEYTPGEAPSCLPPTGLDVVADGLDATVTWESNATQWQVAYSTSATDDPDDNIAALVNTKYFTETLAIDNDYYFWVRTYCSATDQSSWVGPVSVHIGYCVPTLTSSTTTYYISRFTTTGASTNIDNETTGTGASYSNFYDTHSAIAYPGLSIGFTITIAGGSTYGSAIWVDWNNDMEFSDDERVHQTTGYASSPHSGSFTVPTTANIGNYRMRIVSDYLNNTPSNPCGASTGEFEDYKLTIVEVPSCLTPTALNVTTDGATANATWTGSATSYNIDINGTVTNNVTSPYEFTVALSTDYAVKVQANCPGNETSEWSDVFNFTTPDCVGGHTIGYALTDSYGDGWNGNKIEVMDACGTIITLTIDNGSSNSGSFVLCGDYYQFIWITGSFAGEASFTLTDNGVTLYSNQVGSGLTDGQVLHTIGAAPTMLPKPTALTAGTPGTHEVELSWTENGTENTWQICINDDEDHPVAANTNPFTLTGLTQDTDYSVKVRSVSSTNESCWSDEETFTTAEACAKPTSLTESGITTTSATLSWTGSSDSYRVEYTPWNAAGNDVLPTATMTTYTFPLNGTGTGSVVIRHYDVTNMFRLIVDDIVVKDATGATIYSQDFETCDGNMPAEFTTVDMDGDGYGWEVVSSYDSYVNGDYGLSSASWTSTDGALHPDNWIILSDIQLGGSISFQARGQDPSFPAEKFCVYVCAEADKQQETTQVTNLTIDNLTPNTPYSWNVTGICGDEESNPSITNIFITLDDVIVFTTDGNWNDAANWDLNRLPTASDKVRLDADAVIENGVIAYALKITSNSTGTVTIEDGGQLKQTETAVVTIEKQITAVGDENWNDNTNGYYFIATPLTTTLFNQQIDWSYVDIKSSGTYDLYSFDPTQELEWINYNNPANSDDYDIDRLFNGQGYLYANKDGYTLTFTGSTAVPSLNNTVTQEFEYAAGGFNDWKLVGNPFTCNAYLSYVDGDENVLDADFYTLNNSNTYTLLSSSDPLTPCTGAFVNVSQTGTIQFASEAPISSKGGMLNMNLSQNNGKIDQARVRFGEGHNLKHLSFRQNSSKLYMPVEGNDYAVVYAEAQGEMPVSFKAENNGSYTLSFNTENVEFGYLHLIDNMTGMDVDLLQNPSYSFEAKTTDYASRFKLVFSTGNGVNEESFAFISDGNIILNGEGMLQVVDVMGRIMMQEENATSVSTSGMTPGVYVLRLINGDSVKTQKIVIK